MTTDVLRASRRRINVLVTWSVVSIVALALGGFVTNAHAQRTLTRCLVCGFTEVRTDEVIDRGIVLLAECPRCQHMWTVRPKASSHRAATPDDATPAAA